jgi:hypothetical protein
MAFGISDFERIPSIKTSIPSLVESRGNGVKGGCPKKKAPLMRALHNLECHRRRGWRRRYRPELDEVA